MTEYVLLAMAICGIFVATYTLGHVHGSRALLEPFVCQREHVAKPSVDPYYGAVPEWNAELTSLWLDGRKDA